MVASLIPASPGSLLSATVRAPQGEGFAQTSSSRPAFADVFAGASGAQPQAAEGGETLPPATAPLPAAAAAGPAAASVLQPGIDVDDLATEDASLVPEGAVLSPPPMQAAPGWSGLANAGAAAADYGPGTRSPGAFAKDGTPGSPSAEAVAGGRSMASVGTAAAAAAGSPVAAGDVAAASAPGLRQPGRAGDAGREAGAGAGLEPNATAVASRSPIAAAAPANDGPTAGENQDRAGDIGALLQRVQQAERKPLPDGVARAIQARQSGQAPQVPVMQGAAIAGGGAGGPGPAVLPAGAPVPGSVNAGAAGVGAGQALAAAANAIAQAESGAEAVPGGAAEDGADESAPRALAQTPHAAARAPGNGVAPPAAGMSLPPGLPPGTPAWGQAVGERILVMSAGNLQVAEIQLDPPELGSLQVRLQIQHEQVSLSFSSPHAAVRDALEQQMPRLREMLAEQGLNLEHSTVAEDSGRRDQGSGRGSGPAALLAEPADEAGAGAGAEEALSLSLVDQYV